MKQVLIMCYYKNDHKINCSHTPCVRYRPVNENTSCFNINFQSKNHCPTEILASNNTITSFFQTVLCNYKCSITINTYTAWNKIKNAMSGNKNKNKRISQYRVLQSWDIKLVHKTGRDPRNADYFIQTNTIRFGRVSLTLQV